MALPVLFVDGDLGDAASGYEDLAGVQVAVEGGPVERGGTGLVALGSGPALDELYITTAHEFWSEAKKAEFPFAGALYKVGRDELRAKLGRTVTGLSAYTFNL